MWSVTQASRNARTAQSDGPERLQEMRVPVDPVGVLVYLQVADQVADDETDEDHAGDGHDQLSAYCAAEKVADEVH